MLDVDKQQEWEDPFTGKVKKNIPNEWFNDNEQEAF